MVFVRIQCTEKCTTSFHNDALKYEVSPCFSSSPKKLDAIFQPTFFPDLTLPGYPHKASDFEYRLCNKIFSGEAGA